MNYWLNLSTLIVSSVAICFTLGTVRLSHLQRKRREKELSFLSIPPKSSSFSVDSSPALSTDSGKRAASSSYPAGAPALGVSWPVSVASTYDPDFLKKIREGGNPVVNNVVLALLRASEVEYVKGAERQAGCKFEHMTFEKRSELLICANDQLMPDEATAWFVRAFESTL